MTGPEPKDPLSDFDARLRKARERREDLSERAGRTGLPSHMAGMALRIGVELVAAMVVGVGAGYLLDRWLGTSPWLLVVGFFLGAGAGIVNVYRAVNGLGYAAGYRQDDKTGGESED